VTDPKLLLIPEEREHRLRSSEPGAYSADEGAVNARDDKGHLAFFTPSAKGGAGPSYVGPPARLTTMQRWRAWLTAYFGG